MFEYIYIYCRKLIDYDDYTGYIRYIQYSYSTLDYPLVTCYIAAKSGTDQISRLMAHGYIHKTIQTGRRNQEICRYQASNKQLVFFSVRQKAVIRLTHNINMINIVQPPY